MLPRVLELFISVTCRIKTDEKKIFLTFDDGPVPEATPQVLEILGREKAKATFFCIGENIIKHPDLFRQIIDDGHAVGNHTFHHLNGWHNTFDAYLNNIEQCKEVLEKNGQSRQSQMLFRPPYGKLTYSQYAAVKKKYKIVMWDVLTYDWKKNRSPLFCYDKVIRKAVPGSIIVFHDSIKAKERMLPALEMTIKHFSQLGFQFDSLDKYL